MQTHTEMHFQNRNRVWSAAFLLMPVRCWANFFSDVRSAAGVNVAVARPLLAMNRCGERSGGDTESAFKKCTRFTSLFVVNQKYYIYLFYRHYPHSAMMDSLADSLLNWHLKS